MFADGWAPSERLHTVTSCRSVSWSPSIHCSDFVGLYAGVPRTASVVAEDSSEVLRIDAAALARMEREHPAMLVDFHRLIAATLARRLSRTTALLANSEIQAG